MVTKEMIEEAKAYYAKKGENITNPRTIQEKIHWLQINDSTPLKTRCADKALLGKYCEETIGENICIPILKVYKKVEDIEWEKLPKQFVMKCNHGSAMNIIVSDKSKLNISEAKEKLKKWMATDFTYVAGRELHYHDIPRRIIVEKYMEDAKHKSLTDYKMWCFNGEPKFTQVITDRGAKGYMNHYDMNWKFFDPNRLGIKTCPDKKHPKPKNFEKMVEYAKKLSKDFKLVRVDFYEINGTLYLGELTFTPAAGLMKYKTLSDSIKAGNMLDLKA